MIKILLMNIPSGPYPTESLPVGISRVIEGLNDSLECDVKFIDVDFYRYPLEKIKTEIEDFSPQIIGFSAVLTHAYAYVKKLSLYIDNNFPGIIQVLGGEMSVVSNILLQRTKIDFCVVGESEPTFSQLVSRLEKTGFVLTQNEDFADIKGLAYLKNGIPFFTGYAERTEYELKQMNYGIFSKYTDIERFFPKITSEHFRRGINQNEIDVFFSLLRPENRNKRIAQVSSSKGCVGRCTFCHRFFKGYRTAETDQVIKHIEELKSKHDIGLIKFAEENFGSDRRSTDRIIKYLHDNKLNWIAAATRVDNVDEQTIKKWKEYGCVSAGFGFESCSQKILNVMEKRTTVQENLDTLRWCSKYGIMVGLLIVIGMPGENEETIDETIDNFASVIPDDINMPYEIVINYFQAVPGTPGYEYARRVGLVGLSLQDEEDYLESLYEVNANDISHYLNFTDYKKEELIYWKHYIFLELITAFIKKHGLFRTLKYKKANRYKYAAIYMALPRPVRRFILKYMSICAVFGTFKAMRILFDNIFYKKEGFFGKINDSLRKIMKQTPLAVRPDDIYTNVLRDGR